MRFFQDEADLTARFKQQYALKDFKDIPVDFPSSRSEAAVIGPWKGVLLRFRVSRLAAGSKQIGTQGDIKRYRNYGSVLLQVIGPYGEGPGRLLKVADEVGNIFVAWRQGGMLCYAPSAGELVEEKTTVSITVSVPYTSDFKADKQGNVLP